MNIDMLLFLPNYKCRRAEGGNAFCISNLFLHYFLVELVCMSNVYAILWTLYLLTYFVFCILFVNSNAIDYTLITLPFYWLM